MCLVGRFTWSDPSGAEPGLMSAKKSFSRARSGCHLCSRVFQIVSRHRRGSGARLVRNLGIGGISDLLLKDETVRNTCAMKKWKKTGIISRNIGEPKQMTGKPVDHQSWVNQEAFSVLCDQEEGFEHRRWRTQSSSNIKILRDDPHVKNTKIFKIENWRLHLWLLIAHVWIALQLRE